MEYTNPHTPQNNGKVERAYSLLFDHIREMMNDSGLDLKLRETLWSEADNTIVYLDNIVVKVSVSSYYLFYNRTYDRLTDLKRFGEMCII